MPSSSSSLFSAHPLMARLGRGCPRSLSSNDTVPVDKLCQPFCNPSNASGYCPTPCLNYCPDVCHKSFSPPDAPLPPPSTYNSPEVSLGESHHSSALSVFQITIFAAISAVLIVTCVYGLLVWARQRRRRVGHGPAEFLQSDVEIGDDDFLDEDRGPIIDHPIWYIRTIGLDASVIDGIAVCRYNRGESLVEGTDCSVCLSEFQEDETLRLLPKCSHAFHIQCIDEWLRSRTNCPVCRAPVLADGRQWVPDHIPEEPVSTSDLIDRGSMQGDDDADLSLPSDGMELDEGRNMRRSASMDSLSAAEVSVAVSNASRKGDSVIGIKNATNLDQYLVRLACRNLAALSSSASSSSSMRRTRSLSWSGRFLSTATRYGWNRSTILLQ